MGNESSKDSSSSDSSTNEKPSRLSRFKQKLHFRRPRNNGSTSLSHQKLFTADDFAGIALLTLIGAEMKFEDKWLACVSLGERTFRTEKSDNTDKPIWNSVGIGVYGMDCFCKCASSCCNCDHYLTPFFLTIHRKRNFFWKKKGLTLPGYQYLRNSPVLFGAKEIGVGIIFLVILITSSNFLNVQTNRVLKNNLIGYCEIDLLEFLTRDSDSDFEVFDLFNLSSPDIVVGNISLSCSVEDPIETEKNFARRILSIVDYDEDGKLSFLEFSDLISAFGNQVAVNKKEELFKTADANGDGLVSMDELAALLALQQEKY
ncbi:hypothetical protein Pint_32890 [Pistacia integerrima]|uniref:Uncharacterized protein n=1 Tax=Pistacia integerrima TaxID=434235 RepID=A0ACC0X6M6_9ROSI|nr:hypothetical protein Pint_32890 [Pistacia integerrima]